MMFAGTLKPVLPINSFVLPIFHAENGSFFSQEVLENKIFKFQPVYVVRSEMIIVENQLNLEIGDSAIYCFLFENGELIYGHKYMLHPLLYIKLLNKELNPFAREIICAFLNLHGMRLEIISECNEYLNNNNVKCKIVFNSNIRATIKRKKLSKAIKSLYIRMMADLNANTKAIKEDYYAFVGRDVYVNNIKTTTDMFFKDARNNFTHEGLTNVGDYLIRCINSRIANHDLIQQEEVYRYLLSDDINFNQIGIDRMLSPSYEASKCEVMKESLMERSYEIENEIIDMKINSTLVNEEREIIRNDAIRIKSFIKERLYGNK
jgi:hypothetical protein